MASASLLAALAAETKYSDLDDVTVSSGRKIETWKNGAEKKIRVYEITALNETEICRYGAYMVASLEAGENIDANLAAILLHLATHMRDPEDIANMLLLAPVRDKKYIMPLKLTELSGTTDTDEVTEEERKLASKMAETMSPSDKILAQVAAASKPTSSASDSSGDDASSAVKASFYTYFAGFLMRLQCRQSDNIFGNINSSRDRFKGWYDEGYELFDTLSISKASLDELKAVLTRKPEITGTWVMWLANTENEKVLNKQPRGLLEYIGLQIYAYQGLHVMTQILRIKELSGAPLGMILRQLDCPLTREGIREIVNVIKNHEVTTANTERKTYFRYSRVWGDEYFTKIRSSGCAPLLYTAAVVVKEIDVNAKSDPTKIYAIQHIGDSMRLKLKEAALRLVNTLLENTTVDGESGGMWHADA